MNKTKEIIFCLIILLLSIGIVLLIYKEEYGISVALAGILATMSVPFITKDLELEKHRQKMLFEKKYEAYSKYFEHVNHLLHESQKTLLDYHIFNTHKFNSESDFNNQKAKILKSLDLFYKLKGKINMPAIEIFMFANNKIINQIEHLTDKNAGKISSEKDLNKNIKNLKKYIENISNLADLMRQDLGIKDSFRDKAKT